MHKNEVYIGRWRKIIRNEERLNQEKTVDIYVFYAPELIDCNNGIIRVHPRKNNYKNFQIINDDGFIKEKPKKGILAGIGVPKDFLFKVGDIDLLELSEKMEIKKEQLESVLSGC